jgi:hypothetical protein
MKPAEHNNKTAVIVASQRKTQKGNNQHTASLTGLLNLRNRLHEKKVT